MAPSADLVIWEGPVALGAAGVVVVDEGHSVLPRFPWVGSLDVHLPKCGIAIINHPRLAW